VGKAGTRDLSQRAGLAAAKKKEAKSQKTLVGAGRFERPTPCAQGIEALYLLNTETWFEFNDVPCHHLQSQNSHVVDYVAGNFLGFQQR